jgi:hypothetical protein
MCKCVSCECVSENVAVFECVLVCECMGVRMRKGECENVCASVWVSL